MTSLWLASTGAHTVDLRRYSHDFRVLLGQLEEEGYVLDLEHAIVTVGPYDAFIDWATAEEPDWNRYTWDAVKVLIERKKLPASAIDKYDSPDTWAKIRAAGITDEMAYRIGWMHYVQSIATSILVGDDMPPLVSMGGQPADGRHRTIAAYTARMEYAPVLNLEPA